MHFIAGTDSYSKLYEGISITIFNKAIFKKNLNKFMLFVQIKTMIMVRGKTNG